MAESILFHHDSGRDCYVLWFDSQGRVWNGSALVSYATANLGDYDVAATELGSGSGLYAAAVPALPAGIYAVVASEQLGVSPQESDTRVAVGSFCWDGSVIVVTPTRGQITGGNYALATNPAGQVQVTPEPALADQVDDASPDADAFAGSNTLSSSDDFYIGCVLAFTSGALKGLARRVSDYVGSTRTFTVSPAFPAAPADEDAFLLIGRID